MSDNEYWQSAPKVVSTITPPKRYKFQWAEFVVAVVSLISGIICWAAFFFHWEKPFQWWFAVLFAVMGVLLAFRIGRGIWRKFKDD